MYSNIVYGACPILNATKKDQTKSTKIKFKIFVSKAIFSGTIFQIQFPRSSAAREVSMNILKNKYAIFKVSLRYAIYIIYPPPNI